MQFGSSSDRGVDMLMFDVRPQPGARSSKSPSEDGDDEDAAFRRWIVADPDAIGAPKVLARPVHTTFPYTVACRRFAEAPPVRRLFAVGDTIVIGVRHIIKDLSTGLTECWM